MSTRKLYQHLASSVQARLNCAASGNAEWLQKHSDNILSAVHYLMPSGSGIDGGTILDLISQSPNRLVFYCSFHHMDEGGYDGWTDHTIIVTPDLAHGFDLRVTGRDRNEIKDYLAEVYHAALSQDVSADDYYQREKAA